MSVAPQGSGSAGDHPPRRPGQPPLQHTYTNGQHTYTNGQRTHTNGQRTHTNGQRTYINGFEHNDVEAEGRDSGAVQNPGQTVGYNLTDTEDSDTKNVRHQNTPISSAQSPTPGPSAQPAAPVRQGAGSAAGGLNGRNGTGNGLGGRTALQIPQGLISLDDFLNQDDGANDNNNDDNINGDHGNNGHNNGNENGTEDMNGGNNGSNNGHVNGHVNSYVNGYVHGHVNGVGNSDDSNSIGSSTNTPESPRSRGDRPGGNPSGTPPPPSPPPPASFHPPQRSSSSSHSTIWGASTNQPGPPPYSSRGSGSGSYQRSQFNLERQGRSDETHELQDEGRNILNQSAAVSGHGLIPPTPQENTSYHQTTSIGASPINATGMEYLDRATIPFEANSASFRPQPHELSYGTGQFPQSSHHSNVLQPPLFSASPFFTVQTLGSSIWSPVAPSSIARSQQSISQSVALPRWQPDNEVTSCPICNVRFSMFFRKHHCRKCGKVVCDGCSPHRIVIPHPYIVRPLGYPGPPPQLSYPGVERGIVDFSSIGGGERVRLCNPCVLDPNTAPSQPQEHHAPMIVDGRASRARPPSNSISPHPLQLPSHGYTPRTRSATTSAGQGRDYYSFHAPTARQHPSNTAYFAQPPLPHRRVSSSGDDHRIYIGHFGSRAYDSPSSSFSTLGSDRPLPMTPASELEAWRMLPEEDICPACHRELPSRSLPNYEALRETHINDCIASYSNYRVDQVAAAVEPSSSHGTPPPRTTRRTRMISYVATEKDAVGDVECTICLEEFMAGDEMARLECFCRFHHSCIDSWFVKHPGRCPVHQHDSFGY
ncbi:hypothetical protein F4802DRAFT_445276 [Xylaria palmicola]|nr:hypothetical protein F4802DRAFT_445276 [Xylaria palmicola]